MDNTYWEKFYSKQNAELRPSLFAVYVNELFNNNKKKIIELGCGNGRDSIFFANNQHDVLAIDQCKSEISFLQNQYKQIDKRSANHVTIFFILQKFNTAEEFYPIRITRVIISPQFIEKHHARRAQNRTKQEQDKRKELTPSISSLPITICLLL